MTTELRVLMAAAVLICGGASTSYAQEKGAFGLTMGYPTSIGAVWHLSNSIALRPEVNFSFGSSERSSEFLGESIDSESDRSQVEFGISVLFYQQPHDRLRTYFAPRFAYSHTSTTSSIDLVVPDFILPPGIEIPDFDDFIEDKITSSTYSFGGAFGGQYALHDRFGVYGEVGINFTTLGSSTSPGEADSWTLGLRSAVGVILYLR
jgi:hypothetical protein